MDQRWGTATTPHPESLRLQGHLASLMKPLAPATLASIQAPLHFSSCPSSFLEGFSPNLPTHDTSPSTSLAFPHICLP